MEIFCALKSGTFFLILGSLAQDSTRRLRSDNVNDKLVLRGGAIALLVFVGRRHVPRVLEAERNEPRGRREVRHAS